MLFALGFAAEAQQPKKVPRIGYLLAADPASDSDRFEGIRLALRERGYIERKNIATEYRYAEGKRGRLPELAAELVRGSGRPRMQPRRFPSLWWALGPILLGQAWLKALLVPAATLPASQPLQRKQIAEIAVKSRLPAMYINPTYVEDGGLTSYGASIIDLYRRAAVYVDKILKGTKPADLPVEQPTKFEFVINLKTAKQIGLTIPPNVLARADRVIK
jgi:hypothetical protein